MPSKSRSCPYGPTNTFTVKTPIGGYSYTCCPKGLHSMGMVDDITDDNFCPDTKQAVCLVSQLYQDNGYTYPPATHCLNWLQAYFTGHKDEPLPKVCPHIGKEGSFTNKAWTILQKKVPYGKTISYQGLARLCGNARACRAVGQAMRNNPVGLVIPCHRVLPEGGGVGNYHHGTRNKVKEWLLKHEGSLK